MGKRQRRRERKLGERKEPNKPKVDSLPTILDEAIVYNPADDPTYAKYVQDKMDGKLD